MSLDDSQVIEKLSKSGEGLEPRDGWEDGVRRRLRADSLVVERPQHRSLWLPGFVLAGAIAAVFFIVDSQRQAEQERAENEKIALLQKIVDLEEAMTLAQLDIDMAQARMDAAFDALEAAQTEEAKALARSEREYAKNQLKAKREELQRLRNRAKMSAKSKAKAKRKKDKVTIDRCAKSIDPLCGL